MRTSSLKFATMVFLGAGFVCGPAWCKDNVIVTNKCDVRVRLFVRVSDSEGYSNFGWWVFAPGESNQKLSQEGHVLIHDHSKKIYFYAEGIGNNMVWSDKKNQTKFEGETYNLAESSNTDDENNTPVFLSCD